MKWMEQLFSLPRAYKQLLEVLADVTVLSLALVFALALRFSDGQIAFSQPIGETLAITLPLTILLFYKLGLYQMVVRYVGTRASLTLLTGSLGASVLLGLGTTLSGLHAPGAVYAIYSLLVLVGMSGTRLCIRSLALYTKSYKCKHIERIAIYGAGAAGKQLFGSLDKSCSYRPVAFIDDDTAKEHTTIDGVPVYSLEHFQEKHALLAVERILLAMPSVPASRQRDLLHKLTPLGQPVMLVPGIEDLVSGRARINELREVTIDDLLGRDPVQPSTELLSKCIAGKTVLVTGAGGSIGSELCRQVVALGAKRLLMLEISEFALYSIHQELTCDTEQQSITEVIPLLGSVADSHRLAQVFRSYPVDTVYHAAAYKHVPMVEHNQAEGVRNNIIGTLRLAQAARNAKVTNFTLISTDKAVRPTNVMGATKRIAEMVLQAMQAENRGRTTFSMVRFGNVLGSSGSVIPLFRKQIAKGGPITVTHPDIVRYFMTIPEAVELVIQAGAMAEGGDLFVLDMGQPEKITDLASRMIRLSGLTVRDAQNPTGDIAIEFCGLRPGEKLYEELLIGDNVSPTEHPKICRAREDFSPWPELMSQIHDLELAARAGDVPVLRELLLNCAKGYTPHHTIDDWLWAGRSGSRWDNDNKVVALR